MMLHGTGRRLRLTAVAAALLLALTACGTAADDAGQPEASAAPSPATSAAPEPSAEPSADGDSAPSESDADEPAMPASQPVRIDIPALDRTSELIVTGQRADGTLEVPPGAEGSPASWYDGSPTPGERGASVILGHVNSLSDVSGVFYELDTLEPGDEIRVTREDGSTAVFAVDHLESFPKDEFPTRAVYYPVPGAELRLITCDDLGAGGDDFPNNTVVFATLVPGA
ncbi:Sortase family protein [Agrococcus baldri]|uniref:Sortase family protein n=1 Tax=Agrococcus baldri TaxID=153730 RepID=A0AA94KYK9_9MICO|nr:class F sortase [Agrococcus baldri]SFR99722.1 Sortase family protein [Agrococcus baldri]